MSKLNNKTLEEREEYINAFNKYNHVLTKNQYQVFYLYYIEDLSISEISNILVTTRSNAHDTLTKARNNLKPFINIDKLNNF